MTKKWKVLQKFRLQSTGEDVQPGDEVEIVTNKTEKHIAELKARGFIKELKPGRIGKAEKPED